MDVFRTPDSRFEGLPGYAFEPNYSEIEGLRLHYIDEGDGRPVVCSLVAFSDNDPVFPYPKGGERFVELIPTVDEQVRIEGAAHFLQEDRGELIAERMLSFLGAEQPTG